MSEVALGKPDARARARELDAAASPLDVHTDTDFRETLAIVWRATGYIRFFKARFAVKFLFMWLSLLTPLILPWPIKMVIDNVVLGLPVDATAFPPYFAPFLGLLDGLSPAAMMAALVALMATMVALFGAFQPGVADYVEAGLAEGHDTATQTENEANAAFSKFAGVLGLIEFRLQLRLTQALNHLLRAQLFERIMALPAPFANDQRIGDSLYRVMYDTTDIANVFYQFIISPTLAVLTAGLIFVLLRMNYGDTPEVVYLAAAILPLQFLALLPFPRLMRRRSQASHAAGAVTTGNIEEGMSNVLAVQSLGGNKRERRRFEGRSAESFRRFRGQVLVGLMYRVAMGAASGALGLVAFFIVTESVIAGVMTPGDYGVVLYYYAWLAGSLTAIPYLWIRMQHSIPGIRRVFFLMDLPSEAETGGIEIDGVYQGLEMRGVGLVYPDGRRALADIDLTARVGEVVALVGPTGAGKTSPRQPRAALPQPHDRPRQHRRRRRGGTLPAEPASAGGLRLPGNPAVLGFHTRQSALRQQGGEPSGRGTGGAHGWRPRLHHGAAPRLHHGTRHRDQQALGGPEAAHQHRPGAAAGSGHPDSGRTHLRAGPGNRVLSRALPARGRQEQARHPGGAQTVDHRPRRPRAVPRRRPRRRTGHPGGVDGPARRPLPGVRSLADRRRRAAVAGVAEDAVEPLGGSCSDYPGNWRRGAMRW